MIHLLIDFGASRLKSAIVDLKSSKLSFVKDYKSVDPVYYSDGRCEVSAIALIKKFKEILSYYRDELGVKFDGIYISSEMHGFILLNSANEPISEYVSWKDERSLNKIDGQIDSFNFLKDAFGKNFKQITGMKPRAGLPVFNIFHMIKSGQIREDVMVISLPDFLSSLSQDFCKKTHATMLAGIGFYDINKGCVSEEILSEFRKISDVKISFLEVVTDVEISGYWHHGQDKIPIYSAVGDHQCAVLGAGNNKNTISLNLGTGSQISIIGRSFTPSNDIELRPFFNDEKLQCVTHIPSGRAFMEYIGFLEEVRNVSNGNCDFWKMLSELTCDEVINSTLDIDLAIFLSAQNYKNFTGISKISEKNFNLKNYLASLVRSYADQFLKILKYFEPLDAESKIILSGGISRNLPVLKEYLERKTFFKIDVVKFTEETFLGLTIVALMNNEKMSRDQVQQFILTRNANKTL